MKTGNHSTGRWMALGGALVLGTAMLATSPAQAGLLDRVERHVERRLRAHDRVRDAIHDSVRHTVRRHSDRDRHRGHRGDHRRDRDRHRSRDYDRNRNRHRSHDYDRHRGYRNDRRGHRSRHFDVPREIRHQRRSTYRGYYSNDSWYAPHRHDHAIYSFPVWDGRDYRYSPFSYCEGELYGAPRGYNDGY